MKYYWGLGESKYTGWPHVLISAGSPQFVLLERPLLSQSSHQTLEIQNVIIIVLIINVIILDVIVCLCRCSEGILLPEDEEEILWTYYWLIVLLFILTVLSTFILFIILIILDFIVRFIFILLLLNLFWSEWRISLHAQIKMLLLSSQEQEKYIL